MTPAAVTSELDRLAAAVSAGSVSSREALDRAYVLGAECERLEAMHRACEDYSRARAAREQAFGKPPSVPPGRR